MAFIKCNMPPEDGFQIRALPAASIVISDLQKAQTVLPKLEFNRHTPIPIVQAQICFVEMGLIDLYFEKGLVTQSFSLDTYTISMELQDM
jgi:hypothetical protein